MNEGVKDLSGVGVWRGSELKTVGANRPLEVISWWKELPQWEISVQVLVSEFENVCEKRNLKNQLG